MNKVALPAPAAMLLAVGVATGCAQTASPPQPVEGAAASPDPAYRGDLVMICSAPTQAPGASNPALDSTARSMIVAEWIGKHITTDRARKLFASLATTPIADRAPKLRVELGAESVGPCPFADQMTAK